MRSRRSSRISLRNKFCVFAKCYVGYQCSCIKKGEKKNKQTPKQPNMRFSVNMLAIAGVILAAQMLQMSVPIAK